MNQCDTYLIETSLNTIYVCMDVSHSFPSYLTAPSTYILFCGTFTSFHPLPSPPSPPPPPPPPPSFPTFLFSPSSSHSLSASQVLFEEELPVTSLGYTSVVHFLSTLSVCEMERQVDMGDWVVYPKGGKKSTGGRMSGGWGFVTQLSSNYQLGNRLTVE